MNKLQTYTISTWNLAGISSVSNIQILKDLIIQGNIDIICLQECKFTQFYMYNYNFLINCNSLSPNNVAMIIRKDLDIKGNFNHPNGKLMSVQFEHFAVVNLHAPSG